MIKGILYLRVKLSNENTKSEAPLIPIYLKIFVTKEKPFFGSMSKLNAVWIFKLHKHVYKRSITEDPSDPSEEISSDHLGSHSINEL